MTDDGRIPEQLYALLPAVFRERDTDWLGRGTAPAQDGLGGEQKGDLAIWLQVHGNLLNQIQQTLVQLLYDHFPDEITPTASGASGSAAITPRNCQAWLLPYFAQLLDVNLVSPDDIGKRAEIASAVAWRQRKGTLLCVHDIAQQVGQVEVEVQEGWKRVATTPRVNDDLVPALALGEADMDMERLSPDQCARHPGLPTATVDLRRSSRAVTCDPNNTAAHTSEIRGQEVTWRLSNPQAAPCFPGTYQDGSRRTPDLRAPDWRRGHFHPRRVLLYMSPPEGLCSATASSITWSDVCALGDQGSPLITVERHHNGGQLRGRKVPLVTYTGLTATPLKISGPIEIDKAAVYRFENIWFADPVEMRKGHLELQNCAVRSVVVHTGRPDADGTVQSVADETARRSEPVLTATGCLIRSLRTVYGLTRLEYCTVLRSLAVEALQASDCIIMPKIHWHFRKTDSPPPTGWKQSRLSQEPLEGWGCVRLSCLQPQVWPDPQQQKQANPGVCGVRPLFISDGFGRPGCGVLHPATDRAIRFGAEDSGEMGAYHESHHCLRQDALLNKLNDYLPVGIEAALIPDVSLWCRPPTPPVGEQDVQKAKA